jgi:carboxylate-amine ligase
LIRENRWRAQRYGVEGALIDHGAEKAVPLPELAAELVEILTPDATALGCATELARLRRIAMDGTSAVRQRRAFEAARGAGADEPEALRAVVDQLIGEFNG